MRRCWLMLLLLCLPSLASAQTVLYLSPKLGDGSSGNKLRAHQSGAWKDCLDLGSHMLCAGPAVPNEVGVVALPTDKDAVLTGPERAALAATLGRAAKNTVQDTLWDIADAAGKPFRRDRNGQQHIKVHGMEMGTRAAPLASYLPDLRRALDVAFHLPVLVPSYMVAVATAWAADPVDETFTVRR